MGEGTALSGEGSSSGSGSTGSGEGGVGLVKHKVSGNSGGAGSVFVPPRAATANEVRRCSCDLRDPFEAWVPRSCALMSMRLACSSPL